jgi:selenocysteine lyase/cysteine desulfurase
MLKLVTKRRKCQLLWIVEELSQVAFAREVLVLERGEERFIRASFQGYNHAADLERLRDALAALL